MSLGVRAILAHPLQRRVRQMITMERDVTFEIEQKKREALAIAIAHVVFVANELSRVDCNDEIAFSLMWKLAWQHLRDLEQFRNGGAH